MNPVMLLILSIVSAAGSRIAMSGIASIGNTLAQEGNHIAKEVQDAGQKRKKLRGICKRMLVHFVFASVSYIASVALIVWSIVLIARL